MYVVEQGKIIDFTNKRNEKTWRRLLREKGDPRIWFDPTTQSIGFGDRHGEHQKPNVSIDGKRIE